MMKVFFALILVTAPTIASAMDTACATKQKNAASFALAQEVGVPVQEVKVIGYDFGSWTEAMAENSGSDTVTVEVGGRTTTQMIKKSYEVFAKQIGATDDCKITKVTKQ